MGRLSEQSIEKTVAWWADTGLPASGLCALGSKPNRRVAAWRKYRPFADGSGNAPYRPRPCQNSAKFCDRPRGARDLHDFFVSGRSQGPKKRTKIGPCENVREFSHSLDPKLPSIDANRKADARRMDHDRRLSSATGFRLSRGGKRFDQSDFVLLSLDRLFQQIYCVF